MMGWVECDKKGEVGEILYGRSVVVLVATYADCHNWREDIVVPFVTTYAVPLRMRIMTYTIV